MYQLKNNRFYEKNKKVQIENLRFAEEIQEYSYGNLAKQILQDYQKYF